MLNYKNRHNKWIKTAAMVVVCLFLLNSVLIAEETGTLAVWSSMQKVSKRRGMLQHALESTRLRYAESKQDRELLELNETDALLLPHGEILASEKASKDDRILFRTLIRRQIKDIMRIMAQKDTRRYDGIKQLILPEQRVLEAYAGLFPEGEKPDLLSDRILDDIIARAFELIILSSKRKGLIHENEITLREQRFIEVVRPIIRDKSNKYFTEVFWKPGVRETNIRAAMANDPEFRQRVSADEQDTVGKQDVRRTDAEKGQGLEDPPSGAGKLILEIGGAAHVNMTTRMLEGGEKVIVFDLFDYFINRAKHQLKGSKWADNFEFVEGDVTNQEDLKELSVKYGGFDEIYASCILKNILTGGNSDKMADIVRGLSGLLKPGGVLYISGLEQECDFDLFSRVLAGEGMKLVKKEEGRNALNFNMPTGFEVKDVRLIGFQRPERESSDVVIIGAGPAGLTAGIYLARAGVDVTILEEAFAGGNTAIAPHVENYPGFAEGISGIDLASAMKKQAENAGAKIEEAMEVREVSSDGDSGYKVVKAAGKEYTARAVIVATGGRYRKLGLAREEELAGNGVSYCATCDGPLFKGQEVVVVGGGQTGVTDALHLSEIASKVMIIERGNALTAEHTLLERLKGRSNVEVISDSQVVELLGADVVEGVVIKDEITGESRSINASAVFVSIGVLPNTEFLKGRVELDDDNFIVTDNDHKTSQDGIFAAGSVTGAYNQIVVSAGDGAIVARAVSRYVSETGQKEKKVSHSMDLQSAIEDEFIEFLEFRESVEYLRQTSRQDYDELAFEGEGAAEYHERTGESLILYADDILEKTVVMDLESTVKNMLAEHGVLKGGKIILFARDGTNAGILERMIKRADPALETMIITRDQLQKEKNVKDDESDEVRALVNLARARGAKDVLALIKGPTGQPEELSDLSRELKVPVIIVGLEKALYSFAQAITKAMEIKSLKGNGRYRGWLVILPPVRTISEDIQRQYDEYQRSLQALVAA